MVLTVFVFFVILSVLVFVHELGHFLAAKKAGILVEEFGFGFPPKLWSKKIGETVYSINSLPVGGFVKLYGEDGVEGERIPLPPGRTPPLGSALAETRSFSNKSKKVRAVILSAGVFMNFFLAVFLTMFLLMYGVMEPSGKVHIERVVPESPAATAGLLEGDVIANIRYISDTDQSESGYGEKVPVFPKDLIDLTKENAGEAMVLTVVRGGETLEATVVPRRDPPSGQGPMGVAISDLELRRYPISQAPVQALRINLLRGRDMLASLGILFWRLITLQPLQAEVAGPIGIAHVTGEAVKFGWKAVLAFASILSLNLAVLNILPIPALDGGRLMFVFLEKILGRRVKPAFEKSAHQVGMIVLLFLILLVSINDILRLTRGG